MAENMTGPDFPKASAQPRLPDSPPRPRLHKGQWGNLLVIAGFLLGGVGCANQSSTETPPLPTQLAQESTQIAESLPTPAQTVNEPPVATETSPVPTAEPTAEPVEIPQYTANLLESRLAGDPIETLEDVTQTIAADPDNPLGYDQEVYEAFAAASVEVAQNLNPDTLNYIVVDDQIDSHNATGSFPYTGRQHFSFNTGEAGIPNQISIARIEGTNNYLMSSVYTKPGDASKTIYVVTELIYGDFFNAYGDRRAERISQVLNTPGMQLSVDIGLDPNKDDPNDDIDWLPIMKAMETRTDAEWIELLNYLASMDGNTDPNFVPVIPVGF